jgi:hypothetical protein
MPVTPIDPANIKVAGWDRLSASKVGIWRSCPRQYWMNYVLKLKEPAPVAVVRGIAVENCISRVLRESPALIGDSMPDRILISPLKEDGSLAMESIEGWPGPTLNGISVEDRPATLERLRQWAFARVDAHFSRCTEEALLNWEMNPNRVGERTDLDPEIVRDMSKAGIELHLQEVIRCKEKFSDEQLALWRAGILRPKWPSPDGFPWKGDKFSPIEADTEEIKWTEAWAISRPWFVDPDAPSFSMNSIHPNHWFQGEYDLVYRWDGQIRIIDLKASLGNTDRSRLYPEQLRMYAWLWWETHGRSETIDGLEIWYLGDGGHRKTIRPPTEKELNEISEEMAEIHSILSNIQSEEDTPTEPSPVIRFAPGGVEIETHPDTNARCRICPYMALCPNGDYDAQLPAERTTEAFSRSVPVTSISNIEPRVTLEGEIFSMIQPPTLKDGGVTFSFILRQGHDEAEVKNAFRTAPRNVTRGLQKDARVRIRGGIPGLWRGRMQIEIDDSASIELSEGPQEKDLDLIDIHPRVNAIGKVWAVELKPGIQADGSNQTTWKIKMADSSGVLTVIGFKMNVPEKARGVERGDVIAVINGQPGEFGGQKQIKCIRDTSIILISSSEKSTSWNL